MFLVHHRAGETHPEALKTEAIIIWRLTASESQSSDHTAQLQTEKRPLHHTY